MTRDPGHTPTAVQYGVGPIGSRIVQTAHDRGYEFVGAIDIDPEKIGVDLGTIVGISELNATITDNPAVALETEPDIVFHSTVSSLAGARPQLEEALAAGADVVSTCEELAYPYMDNPEIAAALDDTAREHEATCLGTGINPGFAMDALPAVVTTACQHVETIRIERIQNAATRRAPLQEKIGAGTSIDVFEDEIASQAGHVGLPESVAMLASALKWDLTTINTEIEPVVADEKITSDAVTVEPGDVAGISQTATGVVDGEERITLDLQMYLGAPDPHDAVHIDGQPDIAYRVENGFHGDITTPAIAVNTARFVGRADPGLATILDLTLPTYARI